MGFLARSITKRDNHINGLLALPSSYLDRSCSKLSAIFSFPKPPLCRNLCIGAFALYSHSNWNFGGSSFFGEVITAKFIFGSLIILGANYYIFLRERAVKKSILQNEFIYILSRSSLRTGLSCLVAIYSQGNLWARF